ncbi:MAG TPA: hypothetical protein VGA67_00945 [Candidatus Dojkabacteria bacterium]
MTDLESLVKTYETLRNNPSHHVRTAAKVVEYVQDPESFRGDAVRQLIVDVIDSDREERHYVHYDFVASQADNLTPHQAEFFTNGHHDVLYAAAGAFNLELETSWERPYAELVRIINYRNPNDDAALVLTRHNGYTTLMQEIEDYARAQLGSREPINAANPRPFIWQLAETETGDEKGYYNLGKIFDLANEARQTNPESIYELIVSILNADPPTDAIAQVNHILFLAHNHFFEYEISQMPKNKLARALQSIASMFTRTT